MNKQLCTLLTLLSALQLSAASSSASASASASAVAAALRAQEQKYAEIYGLVIHGGGYSDKYKVIGNCLYSIDGSFLWRKPLTSASANGNASAMIIDDRSDERAADQKRASAASTQITKSLPPATPVDRANILLGRPADAHKITDAQQEALQKAFNGINLFNIFISANEDFNNFGFHDDEQYLFKDLNAEQQKDLIREFKDALDAGANPNQIIRIAGHNRPAGLSILSYVTYFGAYPLVKLLLVHPNIRVSQKDGAGRTPLFYSLLRKYDANDHNEMGHIACLLLQKDNDPASLADQIRLIWREIINSNDWLSNRQIHLESWDTTDFPYLATKNLELLINLGAFIGPESLPRAIYWSAKEVTELISEENQPNLEDTKWPVLRLLASYGLLKRHNLDQSNIKQMIDDLVADCAARDQFRLPLKDWLYQSAETVAKEGNAIYEERLARQEKVFANLGTQNKHKEVNELRRYLSPSTGLVLPLQLINKYSNISLIQECLNAHGTHMPQELCAIIEEYSTDIDDVIHPEYKHNEMDGTAPASSSAASAYSESESASESDMDVDEDDIKSSANASASANVGQGQPTNTPVSGAQAAQQHMHAMVWRHALTHFQSYGGPVTIDAIAMGALEGYIQRLAWLLTQGPTQSSHGGMRKALEQHIDRLILEMNIRITKQMNAQTAASSAAGQTHPAAGAALSTASFATAIDRQHEDILLQGLLKDDWEFEYEEKLKAQTAAPSATSSSARAFPAPMNIDEGDKKSSANGSASATNATAQTAASSAASQAPSAAGAAVMQVDEDPNDDVRGLPKRTKRKAPESSAQSSAASSSASASASAMDVDEGDIKSSASASASAASAAEGANGDEPPAKKPRTN
jgi:hypothetical protein